MPNELFLHFGFEGWKPVLSALVLPPLPFLWLMLLGARRFGGGRLWAWLLLLAGAVGIWLSSTLAAGQALHARWLPPAQALTMAGPEALQAAAKPATAIVVLGGGREDYAPEYGGPNLTEQSMARLRYGLWLAHETGLAAGLQWRHGPCAVGRAERGAIAATIAARDFGRPLKWTEGGSRDTRGNAARTVALLHAPASSASCWSRTAGICGARCALSSKPSPARWWHAGDWRADGTGARRQRNAVALAAQHGGHQGSRSRAARSAGWLLGA